MTDHPSDEQLADLAADALPADHAAVVEAHIFECPQCSTLLAEAEGLGRLLSDAPDPTMPDDVWERIATALSLAGSQAQADPAPVAPPQSAVPHRAVASTPAAPPPTDDEAWLTQTWPAVPAAGWTPQDPRPQATHDPTTHDPTTLEQATREQVPREQVPYDDAPTAQWQVFVDEADDEVDSRPRRIRAAEAAAAETGPNAPSDHVPRRREGSRLGRPSMSVSRLRSRRDVREERRHASLERYLRPLAIAAAVVVAVGLGGFAIKGLAGAGGDSTSTAALGSSDSAGGAGAAGGSSGVITSGTNYTTGTITAAALKAAKAATFQMAAGAPEAAGSFSGAPAVGGSAAPQTDPVPAAGSAAGSASGAAGTKTVPTPTRAAAVTTNDQASASPAVAGDGSDQRLRDPAALQACLKELQVPSGTTPIMVDLAKFDGRDAAIIVVAGRDGGYEVWAVARDCRAGAGGQLSYTSVPAS